MERGLDRARILAKRLLLRDDELGAHRHRRVGVDDDGRKHVHADQRRAMRLGKRDRRIEQARREPRGRQMDGDGLDGCSGHSISVQETSRLLIGPHDDGGSGGGI
jgi:hypothetical protein